MLKRSITAAAVSVACALGNMTGEAAASTLFGGTLLVGTTAPTRIAHEPRRRAGAGRRPGA